MPIGTGRLAAMIMGSVPQERVALNHEWLWLGVHRFRDTEPRSHSLPEVRKLLMAGEYEKGTLRGNEAFGGGGGCLKEGKRVDPYQPAGDLVFSIERGRHIGYRRQLDLESGLVTVEYDEAGRTIPCVRKERQIRFRVEAGRKYHVSPAKSKGEE